MEIGLAIKTIRQREEMNQEEFSKLIGITQTYLSQLENGKKYPSYHLLEMIGQQFLLPLPILLWFGVEEKDVKAGKEEIYRILKPTMDELIYSLFFDKEDV